MFLQNSHYPPASEASREVANFFFDDDDEKCLFATQIIEHTGHSLLIRVIHGLK